jgi:hypothetical protein
MGFINQRRDDVRGVARLTKGRWRQGRGGLEVRISADP